MRVVEIAREETGGHVRLHGRIVWEQASRPPEAIWLETPEEHAAGVVVRGETFALAALLPAMERGERRVAVEAPLCPTFVRGVRSAERALRSWSPGLTCSEVEPLGGLDAPVPARPETAATTFSGGVDSLAAIAANRLDVPREHPASVAAR